MKTGKQTGEFIAIDQFKKPMVEDRFLRHLAAALLAIAQKRSVILIEGM